MGWVRITEVPEAEAEIFTAGEIFEMDGSTGFALDGSNRRPADHQVGWSYVDVRVQAEQLWSLAPLPEDENAEAPTS